MYCPDLIGGSAPLRCGGAYAWRASSPHVPRETDLLALQSDDSSRMRMAHHDVDWGYASASSPTRTRTRTGELRCLEKLTIA